MGVIKNPVDVVLLRPSVITVMDCIGTAPEGLTSETVSFVKAVKEMDCFSVIGVRVIVELGNSTPAIAKTASTPKTRDVKRIQGLLCQEAAG